MENIIGLKIAKYELQNFKLNRIREMVKIFLRMLISETLVWGLYKIEKDRSACVS